MSAAVCVFRRPAPIRCQEAVFDEAMERGIGPVCRTMHPAVLYRIEMDVVDMPREIGVIADLMFPVAALPDAAFSFGASAGVRGFGAGQLSREARFDQRPAQGEVGVAGRQAPDGVQVFRKDDHGQEVEGMGLFD